MIDFVIAPYIKNIFKSNKKSLEVGGLGGLVVNSGQFPLKHPI